MKNRELKFRIWNNHGEEMSTDQDFFVNGNKIVYDNGKSYEDREIDNDIIVMQYTGLKDKDGKEIYEGDVLEIDSEWHEVNWSDEDAMFWANGLHGVESIALSEIAYECFIQGNIYENPELLNETQKGDSK